MAALVAQQSAAKDLATFSELRTIANVMLKKVKKLPYMSEDATLKDLAGFSHTIQNLVASLRDPRMAGYLNNPALLADITAKMSYTLKMAWLMELRRIDQKTQATVLQFAAFLKEIADAIPFSGMVDPVPVHK